VRGAVAALRTLAPGRRAVSASAGNHALGMAWASGRTGVAVTVVTAESASAAKLAALARLARPGSSAIRLVQHGLSYDEAEAYARGLIATDPTTDYVSAYSDYAVIAGAATIGTELGTAAPPDERITVVTSLGGGGLASGLTLWAGARGRARVVAVETEASRAVSAALAAGHRVTVPVGATVADGLAGNLEDGCPTPGILATAHRGAAQGVVTTAVVREVEIAAAVRWLYATLGLVAEGAGATAVAAVLAGRVPTDTGRLVVLVTGRNVTAETYTRMLTEPEAA
jgi:threonine dehydratase